LNYGDKVSDEYPADEDEAIMTDNRFGHVDAQAAEPTPGAAFLLVPVASVENAPVSPLQWLYQKMYEQATQAAQLPKSRDLFAVMN
jgi:hypothetical protein